MSLSYPVQYEVTIFNAVTLTNAYTGNASSDIDCGGMDAVTLLISYTTGAAESNNTLQLQVDFPDSASTDYIYTTQDVGSGVTTIVPQYFTFTDNTGGGTTTTYALPPIKVNAKKIKFSIKETGVAANYGTCTVKAVFGGK